MTWGDYAGEKSLNNEFLGTPGKGFALDEEDEDGNIFILKKGIRRRIKKQLK